MTDSASFTTPETKKEDLGALLLEVLRPNGSTMGNLSARETLGRALEQQISEDEYEAVKEKALSLGMVRKRCGRGGAMALAEGIPGGTRYEAASAPTFQIGQKLTPSRLKSFPWKSADILRGSIDALDSRTTLRDVVPVAFVRRL